MQPMTRWQLVYQAIPAGGGGAGATLALQNQPDLDGCLIVGFETFTAAQAVADPDRIAGLIAAEAVNVMLTLNEGSEQRFKNMPYTSLVASLNAGVYRECDPFQIAWNASQWRFNAVVTVNTSLMIGFHYIRPEDVSPEERRVLWPGLA